MEQISFQNQEYPFFTPLAIVGLACRLPGADSKEHFWEMLLHGHVNYDELAPDRLNQELYYDPEKGVSGKTYGKIGSCFDYKAGKRKFLNSHHQFYSHDLAHHLICQVAFDACRDAGYSVENFPWKKTGVFMGFTRGSDTACQWIFSSFADRILDYLNETPMFASLGTSKKQEIIEKARQQIRTNYSEALKIDPTRYASRLAAYEIASKLGLNSQTMIMDAACSSSLTAFSIAGRSLAIGEIDAAIVGGASFFNSDSLVLFSKAQSIGSSFSCPFDHRADGLIGGEAHVFLVLKTLEKALRDGDRIQAVIRGIGVSSDGKGKSLWAPRKEGQQEAVRRAYRFGADPNNLCFIEAHATSTPLGDPTEVEAIGDALRELLPNHHKVRIGSVKANVGHTLEAAGLVGLAKSVLVLQNRIVPPQVNIEKLNEHIDWQRFPLHVPIKPETLEPNEQGKPLQVAANSFGIGGLNVHVVLEEYQSSSHDSLVASSLPPTRPSAQALKKPIAVIGMGCVFPEAHTVGDYWKLLSGDGDAFSESPDDDPLKFNDPQGRFPKLESGGYVKGWKYDWKRHKIPPLQVSRANPLQFMILEAVDEAFEQSGYKQREFDRKKTSVFIGTAFESDFAISLQLGIQLPEILDALGRSLREEGIDEKTIEELLEQYKKYFFSQQPAFLDETGSFTPSTLASRITKTFDLMGGAASIDSGTNSFMAALSSAVNMLRSGESRMVVCAGAQQSMSFLRFGKTKQDDEPSDLVFGEGAGAVLLKDLEQAKKDGDRVLAVIHDVTCVSGEDTIASLEEAFQKTTQFVQDEKLSLNLVETNVRFAQATPQKRSDSSQKLERQKGDNSAAANVPGGEMRPVPLGSAAGKIGFLNGASGVASLIKMILSMEHLKTPGVSRNGRDIVKIDAGNYSLRENSEATSLISDHSEGRLFGALLALDSNDLQNYAYSVLVERGNPVPEKHRHAIEKLPQHHAARDMPQRPSGVREESRPGLCALLFPGQGSQYHKMLQSFSGALPECREILDDLDVSLKRLGFPTFQEMAWDEPSQLGRDIFKTQLSLLVADTAFHRLFQRMGGEGDIVLGHSYGEYPALVAAGAWSFESAAVATRHRCRAIEALPGDCGGMLSTNAPRETLESLFTKIETGALHVSNRNTPDQIVVSGASPALRDLDALLKKEKFFSVILRVPAGFHSPLVETVRDPLRRSLNDVFLRVPAKPFLSSVSGRFEADPDVLKSNLVEQMIRPVDFVQMIDKLYAYGVRSFVELGPQTILSNMLRKILAGRECKILHADPSKSDTSEPREHLAKIIREIHDDRLPKNEPNAVATKERERTAPILAPESRTGVETGLSRPLLPDLEYIELSGSPFEMGVKTGTVFRADIHRTLSRYSDLAYSDVAFPKTPDSLPVAESFFPSPYMEEMRGLAEGAGVSLQAVLRHNFSGYPVGSDSDFSRSHHGLGCVFFAGRCHSGAFVQGANIDVPIFRTLSGGHAGQMQLRRPDGKIPHLVTTGTAFLGGIFGVNASGLVLSSAALSEFLPIPSDMPGCLPLPLLNHVLAECGSIESAIACFRNTVKCGSWSFCLTNLVTEQIARIEYSPRHFVVHRDLPFAVAANHQLYLDDASSHGQPLPFKDSVARHTRIQQLLKINADRFQVEPEEAFLALRDKHDISLGRVPRHRTLNTVWRIDNTASLLLDAKERTLKIATTDIEQTDSEDTPHRHAVFELEEFLPELRNLNAGSASSSPDADTGKNQSFTQAKPSRNVSGNLKNVAVGKTITRDDYAGKNTSVEGNKPYQSQNAFDRFVLRMVPAPLPAENILKYENAAIIIGGDENKVAAALGEVLAENGISFFQISTDMSLSKINEFLADLMSKKPISHLFLLAPHDPSAKTVLNKPYWPERMEQGVVMPLMVVKEWIPLALKTFGSLERCAVIAGTSLGGDFGFASHVFSCESGGIAGLLKGIRMETSMTGQPLRTRIVDHDHQEDPKVIASQLFLESSFRDEECEVAYRKAQRYLVRAIPEAISEKPTSPSQHDAQQEKGVWIVTGGARGITALAAKAIAQRFESKLHILGSSPEPDIDENWLDMTADEIQVVRRKIMAEAVARKEIPAKAWERVEKSIEIKRNFRSFRESGIHFEYHICDLCDEKSIRRVLEKIARDDHPIHGVIHGAGFEAACRFEKKKLENVQRTFDVKVRGAVTLLREMERLHLEPSVFVGFSSISGRFGGVGQVDYCAANEMLAKFLGWYARHNSHCRTITFHWPAWGEVGMAVRPESKIALKAAGLDFMPPGEGIDHLLGEIESESGEREILVTDWTYYKRFYPDHVSVPGQVANDAAEENDDAGNSIRDSESNNRLILVGNNADANALARECAANGDSVTHLSEFIAEKQQHLVLEKPERENSHCDAGRETMVVTTPRDPLGFHCLGAQRWKNRFDFFIRPALRVCRDWLFLDANHDQPNKQLVVLTSLGSFFKETSHNETAINENDIPCQLESVILYETLRMWKNDWRRRNAGVSCNVPKVVFLDYDAETSPEIVASHTFSMLNGPSRSDDTAIHRLSDSDCIRHASTINHAPISLKKLEGFLDRTFEKKSQESVENRNWVIVIHGRLTQDHLREQVDVVNKRFARFAANLHFIARLPDSGLSDSETSSRVLYLNKKGGEEINWVDQLASIRNETGQIHGIIHIVDKETSVQSESRDCPVDKAFEMTHWMMSTFCLTKNDPLDFLFAVGASSGDSCGYLDNIAAAMLEHFRFQRPETNCLVFSKAGESAIDVFEEKVSTEKKRDEYRFSLIHDLSRNENDLFRAHGVFNRDSDNFLVDHQINNVPILPMVVVLECFAEAILKAQESSVLTGEWDRFSFKDLRMHQGFLFRSSQPYRFYIRATQKPGKKQELLLELCGDYYTVKEKLLKTDKIYASVQVVFGHADKTEFRDFPVYPEPWFDNEYPEDGQMPIYHGPTLRSLKRMFYFGPETNRAIGDIVVPHSLEIFGNDSFAMPDEKAMASPVFDASVIDAAYFACGLLHWVYHNGVCIPSGIDHLTIGKAKLQPGTMAKVHIEEIFTQPDGRQEMSSRNEVQFNFTIYNDRHEMVYDVSGYRTSVLPSLISRSQWSRAQQETAANESR